MKKNIFYNSIIAVTLGVALSGCGGDDTGLLDKPKQPSTTPVPPPVVVESLSAYPFTLTLTEGDKRRVDVTSSVQAVGITNWTLTDVQETTSLGEISNQIDKQFDYLATSPGMASLTYEVQGGGKTSSSEILVVINAKDTGVNTPPTAQNVTLNTLNNKDVNIDLRQYIFDADGDALTIASLVSASGRFKLASDGITLTFKPAGFIGVDQAVFSVEDGNGGYAIAYIVATSQDANPVVPNIAPTAEDYNKGIDTKNTSVWFFKLNELNLISDADGDVLSLVRIYSGNGRAKINDKAGIRYIPGDFKGVDQFTYVITDGKAYAAGTFTLAVSNTTPDNQAPTAKPVVAIVLEGDMSSTTISVVAEVADLDGDALRIIDLLGVNGIATVNTSNPLEIDYLPNHAVGIDNFYYVVTDGKGGYAQSSVAVTITPKNPSAPTAGIARAETLYNKPVTVNLNAVIADVETANADLILSLITKDTPLGNAVLLPNHQLEYTPKGSLGVDVLTYTVSDGDKSTQGTVVITVNPDSSHTLTANNLAKTVDAGSVDNVIDWLAGVSSDQASGNTFTLINVNGGTLGVSTITGTQLTYTPTAGRYGEDKLIYTVKDSHNPAHYAQGEVTITVTQPIEPEITALTILGEPTIGNILTAQVTCDLCVPEKYKYKWVINGLTASNASMYTYQAADAGFNVRLEITGEDRYQQITRVHSVYGITKVERLFKNQYAFAALKNDGSIVPWGRAGNGDDISGVADKLSSGVITVVGSGIGGSGDAAFAALKDDGSVVAWGSPWKGGSTGIVTQLLQSGVTSIVGNRGAFAALKDNGSVVTWGRAKEGGDSSSVLGLNSGVVSLYSTPNAFGAVKDDGSAIIWGDPQYGGDSTLVASELTSNVTHITGGHAIIAVHKKGGGLVLWGEPRYGRPLIIDAGVKSVLMGSATAIILKEDGSVVAWGINGGARYFYSVKAQLSSGVVSISTAGYATNGSYSGGCAYAALKEDGSVVFWGDDDSTQNYPVIKDSIYISGLGNAFVSVNIEGTVTALTEPRSLSLNVITTIHGVTHINDSELFVLTKLDNSIEIIGSAEKDAPINLTFISQWMSGFGAYAALDVSGNITTWGDFRNGGTISQSVQEQLKSKFYTLETSIP